MFRSGEGDRYYRSSEEAKKAVNDRLDEIARASVDGKYVPYSCTVCDKVLIGKEVCTISEKKLKACREILSPNVFNMVNNATLEEYYKYPNTCEYHHSWMNHMLLSPRGVFLNKEEASKLHRRQGYVCCKSCLDSLRCNIMPLFAIANNNFVGEPPKCLKELTDVELAFLNPLRTYGYCFSFTGGRSMNLKGTLGFYKVEANSIATSMAKLNVLGINVVVLINGYMTAAQRKKAREYATVNVDRMCAAIRWLQQNNASPEWSNIDMDKILRDLQSQQPHLIDNSNVVEGDPMKSNIETTESFSVFFPDGTMNSLQGGTGSVDDFKEMINQAKMNSYDIEFQTNLQKKAFSRDLGIDFLSNACLLQYPYGRGGMSEIRMKGRKGEMIQDLDAVQYASHYSRLVQPQFHKPLISLVFYSLVARQDMMRMACLRVRNDKHASNLVNGLQAGDVREAVAARNLSGRTSFGGSRVSRKFLEDIDAVAGAPSHSNQAAKQGRRNAEAMQSNLGDPHAFVTFCPDDENSLLVQIFSGVDIDDGNR